MSVKPILVSSFCTRFFLIRAHIAKQEQNWLPANLEVRYGALQLHKIPIPLQLHFYTSHSYHTSQWSTGIPSIIKCTEFAQLCSCFRACSSYLHWHETRNQLIDLGFPFEGKNRACYTCTS